MNLDPFIEKKLQQREISPYPNSEAVNILKSFDKLKVAFLDIDSTLTGNPRVTNQVKELLAKQGFLVVFVTARTEEMLMSEDQYKRSRSLGFDRPRPKLGRGKNSRFYLPPEQVEPEGLINPRIIASSSGTRILLKQATGGYLLDKEYQRLLTEYPKVWQQQTLKLLHKLNSKKLFWISPVNLNIETEADVSPPEFRIQIYFDSIEKIHEFKRVFTKEKNKSRKYFDIRVTDDSNPLKGQFSAYLTPLLGSKKNAVERVLKSLAKTLGVKLNSFEAFFAGDSYPDLEMGLFAALNIKATFLIVGGSVLTKPLIEELDDFAGESFDPIRKRLIGKNGRYRFKVSDLVSREVLIGDELFPGTKGPETILAYLKLVESSK